MAKNIYELAKDFPNLQSIMEKATSSVDEVKTGNCNGLNENYIAKLVTHIKAICEELQRYTSRIQSYYPTLLNDSSCIYLYYWLYYYNNKKYVGEVKSLYKELINADDTTHRDICEKYFNTIVTDDVMSNLKDLYDMFSMLNHTNGIINTCTQYCDCAKKCAKIYKKHMDTCKYDSNTYFCKELINIKEKYDSQNLNVHCGEDTTKTLPSFQTNNTTVFTLIPIVSTLAISFFLFILYKFTPYGRNLLCTNMDKTEIYNITDKECNILHLSEMSNSNLRNNEYQILYNAN
ncbi:variable surface protein [Plasmodium gonderi]|uniref:Variable surface protein n=1 Tax=Plasmodium gonderi TaxID=77519 RepID=A0A1Y1JRX0_PLAGO|nr:variable surface protein [Plasmodium gonderi]GAW83947.1 variable surface protein [Plasmodium gonderi]